MSYSTTSNMHVTLSRETQKVKTENRVHVSLAWPHPGFLPWVYCYYYCMFDCVCFVFREMQASKNVTIESTLFTRRAAQQSSHG